MSKRINITLPDTTLTALDRVAPKGARSQFISRAVLHFIESQGKVTLRERLKREALANSGRDAQIAAEWFALEDEASRISPRAAKSSSKGRRSKVA
jgi:CopG family transcriptional regulator / antitoxin EndoAI